MFGLKFHWFFFYWWASVLSRTRITDRNVTVQNRQVSSLTLESYFGVENFSPRLRQFRFGPLFFVRWHMDIISCQCHLMSARIFTSVWATLFFTSQPQLSWSEGRNATGLRSEDKDWLAAPHGKTTLFSPHYNTISCILRRLSQRLTP